MNGRRALVVVVLAVMGIALYYAVASPGDGHSVADPIAGLAGGPLIPHRVAPKVNVTLAAVGDIALIADAGAASTFASVRRYLDGDVVLGNLEGTLTAGGDPKCRPGSSACFAFRAPPSYASLLKDAGFTIMNDANNHAYDFGPAGQADTLASLDRVGLLHTGRPGEITNLMVGPARVAVLGFAPYAWAQSLTDLPAAQALVNRAAAYADLVVVTMHAGAEGADSRHVPDGGEQFLGEDRGDSRAFAHAVVDAGADLVVGSGPHVLRGMEWYRGRLIAYSLGNFAGCRTLSTSGVKAISGVLHVTLRASGRWVGGDLEPIRLTRCGIPERDAAEAAHGAVRTLSRQDFGSRAMQVTRAGGLVPPGT